MEQSTIIRIIRIMLIIIVLGLLIWFIIWLFSPRQSSQPQDTASDTSTQQEQYDVVRYVQDGEITGPEEHYTIVITVSSASRRIDIYQGYNTSPLRSESFANSEASYGAYYAALKNVGFFTVRDDPSNTDRTSYCPLGIRYSYLAGNDISNPSLNSWSASCSAKAGTFAGSKADVKTLFKNQIPEYSTFIKGITL